MKVTIKDIAQMADVSIATVSHAINKTRYVRPELSEKVKKAIKESGYIVKNFDEDSDLRVGKESMIAFVIPHIRGTVYSQLTTTLGKYLAEKGFLLSVHLSGDDRYQERHVLNTIITDKRVAGIILAPVSSDGANYLKILQKGTPIICLERTMKGGKVTSVLSENKESIFKGTKHLVKSGHEKIAILIEDRDLTTVSERLNGYIEALKEDKIQVDQNLIVKVDLYNEDGCESIIREVYKKNKPTAFIASGNRLTLVLLKALQNMGIECPKDVSVVGFGDEEWCELAAPPLTTLKQNTEEMAKLAAEQMVEMIQKNDAMRKDKVKEIRVPTNLTIRKSTQMIGRGPFGEKAVSIEELALTENEIKALRDGDFKIGISFHYAGTAWASLHERGIRDTLSKYGITVMSVTDAHFDPELQVTQLEGLRMQKSDAIIAIPANDEITAQKFKELSKETKLIFISSIPRGFGKKDYAVCVSVNERENGHNAGILLGEYFKNADNAKVGFISHGISFNGTHLRDMVAEQTLLENYANVEVVDTKYFYKIENTYDVCKKMITEHPELQGLYISWDGPALEAIRALEEMERTDIAIVTCDLDMEIASYLAQNKMVVGMSSQKPYDQGIAVAMATAKALLNKEDYKYIGVHPYVVQTKNLLRAWRDIMHENAPESIEKYISN